MPRRRYPKGERRHGAGWQAYVRVAGELRTKTFPLDSTPEERRAWRLQQRDRVVPAPPIGSLGRDAVRWLRSVKHTPDYPNKETYANRWLQRLGKWTPRAAITSQQVATCLSDLLAEGYSPITVRHHRTALQAIWRFCDGPRAPTPVDDTPRPRDPEPETRLVPLDHVRRVLNYLPATKTRARLKVLLTTGIPHKQIGQLQPEDWDRARQVLHVERRRKGRGAAGRYLPLSSAAVHALEEFARADAWGPFSASAVYKRVKEACVALKIPVFRPYDLRHVHGALIYRETGDLRTAARMLGHKGTKTAERYTQAAFAMVDAAAAEKIGPHLADVLEAKPEPELPEELPNGRKAHES